MLSHLQQLKTKFYFL